LRDGLRYIAIAQVTLEIAPRMMQGGTLAILPVAVEKVLSGVETAEIG
jgi:hypothetical protein